MPRIGDDKCEGYKINDTDELLASINKVLTSTIPIFPMINSVQFIWAGGGREILQF